MNLEHVAINVHEPAALAQWLADNFGLKIVAAATASPYAHFLADGHGSMIELYANPNGPIPDYPALNPFTLHFAFTSSDIEADRARLLAAGATPAGEITLTAANDKLCFLRSPWGEPLQLVQRVKPMQ